MSMQIPGLYILNNEKGRAIYSSTDIAENDLIEICPIILIPQNQLEYIDKTIFFEYYFLWGPNQNSAAVALGFGSLYNHSENPNAYTTQNWADATLSFMAERPIKAHEEITINYKGDKHDMELWF